MTNQEAARLGAYILDQLARHPHTTLHYVSKELRALVALASHSGEPPAEQGEAQGKQAQRRDELLQMALDFLSSLTGMTPPPIEVAPPEVFAPFRTFVEQIEAKFANDAPQAQQPGQSGKAVAFSMGDRVKFNRPDVLKYHGRAGYIYRRSFGLWQIMFEGEPNFGFGAKGEDLELLESAPQPVQQATQGEAPAGWQPIETAPKDGAVVWAFNGEQGRMHWTKGEMPGGSWALWAWDDQVLSDVDPEPRKPTHWMPLPPPPAAARPKAGEASAKKHDGPCWRQGAADCGC